jgi:hypothetical protein
MPTPRHRSTTAIPLRHEDARLTLFNGNGSRICGLIATGLLLTGSASAAAGQDAVAGWTTDLHVVRWALHRIHPHAFHATSSVEFDLRLSALRRDLPKLSRSETLVRLAQVIATIRECHTGFALSTTPPVDFHALPIKVYLYADGPFIQAAGPAYRDLVGARLIRIGEEPSSRAVPQLLSTVMASNLWSSAGGLSYRFRGEVLQALGISPESRIVRIGVQRDDATISRWLPVVPRALDLGDGIGAPPGTNWIDARASAFVPLYLQHPAQRFLLVARPPYIYARINNILNSPTETLAGFWQRLAAEYDKKPRPLILDLRQNGGGDNTLLSPILLGIDRRPRFKRAHNLYVIIGRATQSAAENLVARLQRVADVTTVGEPSGETPSQYGDPIAVRLPYSKIMFHVATRYYHEGGAPPNLTVPTLSAALTSREYRDGVDPALRAVERDIARHRKDFS